MDSIPGWYVDAMEQRLGQLTLHQRQKPLTVEQLADLMLDPATDSGELTPEEHRMTLAVCLAITVRRLALVDVAG